jgi:alpha-N-arabinofuranosidase
MPRRITAHVAFLLIASCISVPRAMAADDAPAIAVTRDFLNPGRITNRQSGQFIEYLCNLVPSMWAEKLYDGSFEGLSPYNVEFLKTDFREKPWYPAGAVNRSVCSLDPDRPVSGKVSQKIAIADGPPCVAGIAQDGISVEQGKACVLSCWLRGLGLNGPVRFTLRHEARVFASGTFEPGEEWKKFEARLEPAGSDDNATLVIDFRGPGTLWLDNVSLMPADTRGGWRPDVFAALKGLNAGVVRFGGSALDSAGAGDFEWRDTVGDPDHRPPFTAWGGLQPAAAGLEEIVQLMKAAGSEPLICVRMRNRTAQDAVDELEYFNGAESTQQGARRVKNGHPLPYRIIYWQIGNELRGAEYEKRLPEFCQAMKKADPSIKLLASYPTPGVLRGAGQWIDYVCPHHYGCANLAKEMADLRDVRAMIAANAPGRDIRVAVTEWNTTAGDWGPKRAKLWTLANSLACSRYQNLMHRECDLVEIACRSNLCNSFCSGIIQTNNHALYKTPTWYAQRLYATLGLGRPLKIDPPVAFDAAPDISAVLSDDGKSVTLFAVNSTAADVERTLDISALSHGAVDVSIQTLGDRDRAGEPDATNSFADPERISLAASNLHAAGPKFHYRFPAFTLTVLRFAAE